MGKKVETKEKSSTVHTNGTRPVREGDVVKMNDNNTTGKIYERGGEAARPQIQESGSTPPSLAAAEKPASLWDKASPWVHGALGLASFVPGLSVVTSGADAAIYAAEGNAVEAGIAAVGMIPGGKLATTAAKAGKFLKGAQKAEEAAQAARKAEEAAQAARKAEEAAKAAKEAEAAKGAEAAAGKGKDGGKSKGKNTGKKGECGEGLAKKDLMQEGFEDVVSVQNKSGHGIDLIGRNRQTGEVKVWEVKTTDGASAPSLSKDQAGMGGEKYTNNRLGRAIRREGNYGKVEEAVTNAKKVRDWLDDATKITYEKREVFIDDIEKGCAKHPDRPSRSKPWEAKK